MSGTICLPLCGECCHFSTSEGVMMTREEAEIIKKSINVEVKDFCTKTRDKNYPYKLKQKPWPKGYKKVFKNLERKNKENTKICVFLNLDSMLCKINEAKPSPCRNYHCGKNFRDVITKITKLVSKTI